MRLQDSFQWQLNIHSLQLKFSHKISRPVNTEARLAIANRPANVETSIKDFYSHVHNDCQRNIVWSIVDNKI